MTNRIILLFLTTILIMGCNNNEEPVETTELTQQTHALYNNLKQVSQSGVLFGHQDALAYGVGWTSHKDSFRSDVQQVSGDHPAVFGWDIGHIDSSANIDGIPFDHMKAWIIKAYEKGGINTISWHSRNFLTGGTSWDTTRIVDKILPGGALHDLYKTKLDKIAEFLLSLETSDHVKAPVIFRPYHEHNGHWFWWGNATCNDKEFKQLWRFTADYLRKTKKVNNILLCYSTDAFTGEEEYLARYPGDDYVDILGWDDYKSIRSNNTREIFTDRITVINSLTRDKNKVGVLSEGGYETVANPTWWTDVLLDGYKASPQTDRIAYMLVWRNASPLHHYGPYPGHGSSENFKAFKNDPATLFLNDLPDMYNEKSRKKRK